MTTWLAPVHLALSLVILAWDVVLAGRISQLRYAPRVFATITGLTALLLVPAALIHIGSSTLITGRAVASTDWIWPLVLILFAAQAAYALVRRLVNPLWGIPILVYDTLVAIVGSTRFAVAHGYAPLPPLLVLMSAQSTAMSFLTWSSVAMISPFYLNIPMIAPAFPALRRTTAAFRLFMTSVAIVWVVAILWIGLFRAIVALRLDTSHAGDQVHRRAPGSFHVGLKVLPDVGGVPSAAVIRNDVRLLDTLDASAVMIVIQPGVSRLTIDSVARALDRVRGDSTILIVALGYRGSPLPELRRRPLDAASRLTTLRTIVTQLRPDILLPAEDPYGAGARVHGDLSFDDWRAYLIAAAAEAKQAVPATRIGVAISRYGDADTRLYEWAAGADSPIDVLGFSLLPARLGLSDIQAFERAADRLMKSTPSDKEHWVFASGGYPLAYGERAQERLIWNTLSWATSHANIRGLIVYEAGDYGEARGLRAPNGRLRSAAYSVARAIRTLRESTP